MTQPETPNEDLVLSSNPGRLAIRDKQYGPDLTGGTRVEVFIGDTWMQGRVEHSSDESVGCYAIAHQGKALDGYGYFVLLDAGGVLGLCTGMRVRLV